MELSDAGPRVFVLERHVDETGISGTGIVAEGVVFSDGTCAMRWISEHRSTAVYATLDDLRAIHGHNGQTRIEFVANLEGLVLVDRDYDLMFEKEQASLLSMHAAREDVVRLEGEVDRYRQALDVIARGKNMPAVVMRRLARSVLSGREA